MAIKIIRVCDICETEHEQVNVEKEQTFEETVSGFNDDIQNKQYPIDFICSDCILKIEKLRDMTGKENDGKGISCVDTIITYLDCNDVRNAKAVYRNESDKINTYPEIQEWFYNVFGCSLHFQKVCPIDLCKKLRRYNYEKLKSRQ